MRLILVFVVLLFGFISRAHATATFVVTSIVSEGGFTKNILYVKRMVS